MTEQVKEKKEKTTAKKFFFRGKDINQLLALQGGEGSDKVVSDQLSELFNSRIKRKIRRGLGHRYANFLKKIRKEKKEVENKPGEKAKPVKTHLRNMIVVPEMVGGVVGIHNGKEFANVEIKFDMIGKFLAEFAMSYKPTKHGKPGVGATKGSQHVDKK